MGRQRGKATEQIDLAEDHLRAAREALKSDLTTLGVPVTPIGELVTEFGLDRLSMQILFVIAGPALWPEIARLYAILAANDQGRPLVDQLMLVELLRREHLALRRRRAPVAALRSYATTDKDREECVDVAPRRRGAKHGDAQEGKGRDQPERIENREVRGGAGAGAGFVSKSRGGPHRR